MSKNELILLRGEKKGSKKEGEGRERRENKRGKGEREREGNKTGVDDEEVVFEGFLPLQVAVADSSEEKTSDCVLRFGLVC